MKSLKQKPLARELLTKPVPIAALLLALSPVGMPAYAATLKAGDVLTIDAGKDQTTVTASGASVTSTLCSGSGTTTNGSCFGMQSGGVFGFTSIAGKNGISIGSAQAASGSHTGAPGCTANGTSCTNPGEQPNIDQPWGFFNNTGMHQTTLAVTSLISTGTGGTLNFAGWSVTWNGIASINMGSSANVNSPCQNTSPQNDNGSNCNGSASFAWDGVYGDPYQLWYNATVPVGDPSGFGGVNYRLHLVGKVYAGITMFDDIATVAVADYVDIDALGNDVSPSGKNLSSVVASVPAHGTAVPNTTTGKIRYTADNSGISDSFTYTFKDNNNIASPHATVTVTVVPNTAPHAVNDTVTTSLNASKSINVLANDTDAENNIDPASVTVSAAASHGTTAVNTTTGAITYTPAAGYIGADSFNYTVADRKGLTGTATVYVTVNDFPGDHPALVSGQAPILLIEGGSYFTMQISPGKTEITNLLGGWAGGLILGYEHPAGASHTGFPTGLEPNGIDQPWQFFSNTGSHFTQNGGIGVNSDGTLNFLNRWYVTWNGIPAINMGGDPNQDQGPHLGQASISCTPRPCQDGSTFVVNLSAHVPVGDPSGFGGVPYGLHLVGHERILKMAVTASSGTLAQGSLNLGMRTTAKALTTKGLPADTSKEGVSCVGDCFDFRVTGVTSGGQVQIVLPLMAGIPANSVYRKYTAATGWKDFNTGGADSVKSAPFASTGAGMPSSCPAPGAGAYTAGLTAGNYCVQLTITDGGLNDADGAANGTVVDPGGVFASTVTPVDNRAASSSGCSLSANPVNPLERGDWWLLLGFVAWMGLVIRRKRA